MIKLYDPVTDLKYSKFALIFQTYFKSFQLVTVYLTSTVHPPNTVNSYSLNSPASIVPLRL